MTDAKHTPGPWVVDLLDASEDGRAPINCSEWIGLARVQVRMDGEVDCCDDGLANARLIAAAPDLLEALELVEGCRLAMDQLDDATSALVSGAIAKAKGGAA